MMKRILTIACIFFSLNLVAQQDAMYTQYMFNTLSLNSAFAGSEGGLSATMLNRIQWLTFEGAPTSQSLTVHSPFISKDNGIGISIQNDKYGPVSVTGGNLNYSYKVNITKYSGLALGLNAGLNVLNADLNSLETTQYGDIAFSSDIKSRLLPNFGFGTYFFNKHIYAGISVPRFLRNNYYRNTSTNLVKNSRENLIYYIMGGAVFDIAKNVEFKPSILTKIINAASPEIDFTGLLYFDKKLWVGGMVRTGDALGVITGFRITEQISLGYSYDWSYAITRSNYVGHSHEILLKYNFVFKQRVAISSPRHFIF